MAMGKKKRRQQEDLWVATSELPRTAGHPFYERLNGLFNEHGFDDFVEGLCAKFYADKMGRPSLAPGVYFRLLLIQVSAFNLGMLMRQSLGVGTPRGLQGRICALMLLILSLFKRLKVLFGLIPAAWPEKPNSATPSLLPSVGTT